jgi:hypothetical protein
MLSIKREHKDQGWTFQGTIDENTVKAFCKEETLDFCDIIKVEASTEMLYKHPILFGVWDIG